MIQTSTGMPPSAPLDGGDGDRSGLRALLGRPVVLGAGAFAAVVLVAGGYVLVAGGDEAAALTGVSQRPAPGAPAAEPTPPTASPSSTPAPVPGVEVGSPARNPFAGTTAARPGAPAAVRTVTAPAVVVTRTATRTVTAAPPAPVYLGLYGFTDDGRARFRVNDDPGYTVAAGTVFAKSFKFVQRTGTDPVCAKVLYGDVTTTICDGDVKRMS